MNRSLRVLHLNHTGRVSGAEHSLLLLMRELQAMGHDVVLAAPSGELLDRARAGGLRVEEAPGTDASWRLHLVRTPLALVSIARAAVSLRRSARRGGFEVVHANSLRAGLIAALARVLGGPPVVAHVRDRVGGGRAARIVKRAVASRAARVVVVSEFAARDWAAVGAVDGKLVVVRNGVDVEAFVPGAEDGRSWRRSAGVGEDEPLLAVVGQITPWKRQDRALDAFESLAKDLPGARLVIAGDVKFDAPSTALDNRAYRDALARRVAGWPDGAVLMLGERDDVASLLRAADVLLAPALDEPFGRAVAEALACGTPVVVPPGGGPAEWVREGLDGVVVQGDDAHAWAAACHRALELARAPELAAQRHDHVRAQLSSGAHAAAMERVLREAAEPERGAA